MEFESLIIKKSNIKVFHLGIVVVFKSFLDRAEDKISYSDERSIELDENGIVLFGDEERDCMLIFCEWLNHLRSMIYKERVSSQKPLFLF